MMTINFYIDGSNIFEFESKGHCEHDVCVAVSAIINGLRQYALVKENEDKVKIKDNVYENGHVKLSLEFAREDEDEITSGLEAFAYSFILYAENYPDDVKFR